MFRAQPRSIMRWKRVNMCGSDLRPQSRRG
jgi:hypothetical protein